MRDQFRDTQLQRLYEKAYAWLLSTGPRVVIAIIVLIFGLWLIRMIKRKLMIRFEKKSGYSSVGPFVESLILTVLNIILIFILMQLLGIRLTVFTAAVAAFAAAAGLALSGTMQNFASGILILLLKPFKAGDNIVSQGFEGTVTSIQIFYTIIMTFDNRTVIMPNSKLSNEVIINVTHENKRRLDITMKLNYGIDINQVKKTILDAFTALSDVLKDPAPRVGVFSLDPDGYNLCINVWVKAHGFIDARLVINEKIIEAVKVSGIKLPGM